MQLTKQDKYVLENYHSLSPTMANQNSKEKLIELGLLETIEPKYKYGLSYLIITKKGKKIRKQIEKM